MKVKIGERSYKEAITKEVCDVCKKDLCSEEDLKKDNEHNKPAEHYVELDGSWNDGYDVYNLTINGDKFCSFDCLIKILKEELTGEYAPQWTQPSDERINLTFSRKFLKELVRRLE
ncbi:hypothetical protein LCGC14_1047490 [marine sediment metagenome]|uniref:Uncharacterized protein n=1 Tax=marine sediment metagenome TaxID=412755 RepID=A0A0F9MUC8_9ZZZZ